MSGKLKTKNMMSKDHKNKLRDNRVFLIEHTTNLDFILNYLVQERVLTKMMFEEIQATSTSSRRVRTMLDLLPSRGSTAYSVFLSALKSSATNDRVLIQLGVKQQPVCSGGLCQLHTGG